MKNPSPHTPDLILPPPLPVPQEKPTPSSLKTDKKEAAPASKKRPLWKWILGSVLLVQALHALGFLVWLRVESEKLVLEIVDISPREEQIVQASPEKTPLPRLASLYLPSATKKTTPATTPSPNPIEATNHDCDSSELLPPKVFPTPPLPKGLKIMLLSDIHGDSEKLTEALDLGLEQKPDVCFILGDLATGGVRFNRGKEFIDILTKLQAQVPTYAILGNHDMEHLALVLHVYEQSGIPVLRNQKTTLTAQNKSFDVVGLGDYTQGDSGGYKTALPTHQKAPLPILYLAHSPDSKRYLKNRHWSALFCGHTHGGQIIPPFCSQPLLLPIEDKTYYSGLYTWQGKPLYVSRGIGAHLGIRFHCPSEVTIIKT